MKNKLKKKTAVALLLSAMILGVTACTTPYIGLAVIDGGSGRLQEGSRDCEMYEYLYQTGGITHEQLLHAMNANSLNGAFTASECKEAADKNYLNESTIESLASQGKLDSSYVGKGYDVSIPAPQAETTVETPASASEPAPEQTEAPVVEDKPTVTPANEVKEAPKKEVVEEHVHEYTEVITKEPTCTESGTKTFTCECGDEYTEEIPTAEHKYEETDRVKPTCTQNGSVTHTCSACGSSYTEELDTLGHTAGEWEVTKEAGLFSTGEKVQKCTICGEVLETEVLPQLSPISPIVIAVVIILLGIYTYLVYWKKQGKDKNLAVENEEKNEE